MESLIMPNLVRRLRNIKIITFRCDDWTLAEAIASSNYSLLNIDHSINSETLLDVFTGIDSAMKNSGFVDYTGLAITDGQLAFSHSDICNLDDREDSIEGVFAACLQKYRPDSLKEKVITEYEYNALNQLLELERAKTKSLSEKVTEQTNRMTELRDSM